MKTEGFPLRPWPLAPGVHGRVTQALRSPTAEAFGLVPSRRHLGLAGRRSRQRIHSRPGFDGLTRDWPVAFHAAGEERRVRPP
jgi:hypothetical protein